MTVGVLDIAQILSDVFEKCKERSDENFPNALIPIYSDSPQKLFALQTNETFDFVKTLAGFIRLIDQGHWPHEADAEMFVRFSVLSYCHIMEADWPYLVLLNLCRVTEGLDPDWLFLSRKKNGELNCSKKGNVLLVQNIGEKIESLKKYELATETKIVELLDELWDNKLRNAFSHSQYTICSNGTLRFVDWKKTPMDVFDAKKELNADLFLSDMNEIKARYECAYEYIKVFGEVYGAHIVPYEEAKIVHLGAGDVVYNNESRSWGSGNVVS